MSDHAELPVDHTDSNSNSNSESESDSDSKSNSSTPPVHLLPP
jgi:hypothetical protein